MQLKKLKPREVTKITILVKRLICIALILKNKAKPRLFKFASAAEQILKTKQKYKFNQVTQYTINIHIKSGDV